MLKFLDKNFVTKFFPEVVPTYVRKARNVNFRTVSETKGIDAEYNRLSNVLGEHPIVLRNGMDTVNKSFDKFV